MMNCGRKHLQKNCLTNIFDKDKGNSLSCAALKNCLADCGLQNDLEAAVFPRYPELAEIKNALLRLGALAAGMRAEAVRPFSAFLPMKARESR